MPHISNAWTPPYGVVLCAPTIPGQGWDEVGPPFFDWDGEPLELIGPYYGYNQYRTVNGGVIWTPYVYATLLYGIYSWQFGG
jgi:hypothetical protein